MKEEGRRKKEEGRRKKEEGRRKKEEGRSNETRRHKGTKEDGRMLTIIAYSPLPISHYPLAITY
jgi:hypothetical protein